MKKILAIALVLVMVLGLCACGGKAPEAPAAAADEGKISTIGLCMPTKEQSIWTMQADRLETALTAAGYEVMIEFAEDDSARQATQIENMISKGVDCLIIAAVDSASLTDACEKAKEAGILVIADDRAITNTEAVDYYVTCDYFRLAQIQGQYIVDTLDLDNTTETYTMEIFAGSQDDANALVFHNGQMSILQPYIDAGKIVIKSGQTTAAECATPSWDSAKAQARMDNLLSGYYADDHLDICLSTADCVAIGCISSLESMGYGTEDNPFPIVTGQDVELAAVKNIKAGKQSMSVFIDGALLAEKTVALLNAINAGEEIVPDSVTNNNAYDVPTMLYDPLLITADNYEYLIEIGFYTEAEVNG